MDLVYGRGRTPPKFRVLEVIARVPYQAWEHVAYVAVTHRHSEPRFARRIFDRVAESRAQQDNEQWHLLILEELLAEEGQRQPFVRYRLLPQVIAFVVLPAVVAALRREAGVELPAQRRLRGPRRARVHAVRLGEPAARRAAVRRACSRRSTAGSTPSPTCSARSATTSACTSWRASPRWRDRASSEPRPAGLRSATPCCMTGAMQAFRNFVNGQYVDAADGDTTPVVDPTTGEQYATAPRSGAADIDAAMAAAADAFEGGRTRRRRSVRSRCSASRTRSRRAARS
jgi:hypothetical protein